MTSKAEPDEFQRLLNGYAEQVAASAEPSASAAAPPVPAATSDERETPALDAEAKRALYCRILEEEGYRYKIDEDGDISLRVQGHWLVLFASDDDPSYFRLALPNIFECTSESQTDSARFVANDLNRLYKVGKFVVVDGWVWCGVEMFLEPLDSFRPSFTRCAELLCEAAADFNSKMRRYAEKSAPPEKSMDSAPENL